MITKQFGKGKCLNGNNPNDKIYTPLKISKMIIDMFDIKGTVLDGFMGDGSFYNQYPESVSKDWCEIDKGIDFFKYKDKVDWIITNPPYSILDEVLEHSFEIANNIVYLVPLSKIVISKFGGVPLIYIISASKCKFPFGFPACAIYFKKKYNGETKIIIDSDEVE